MRKSLPIYKYRADIIAAIKEFQVLVVVGDTGSGKTTQIPQYIIEDFPKTFKTAVTQPRRIAAISAAERTSVEQGSRIGNEIGYAIRFERCLSKETRVTYMTDGVLLRECLNDSLLTNYDIVILDEAHERSIETDVLFGLLKRSISQRKDLKLIIMSATLNVEKFSDYFETAPVFSIPGRCFDVKMYYTQLALSALKGTYVRRAVETVIHIHQNCEDGDVLVFLTGHHDIHSAMRLLHDSDEVANQDLLVLPLYSTLDSVSQRAIFDDAPRGKRKIVLATNIAQTSLTIKVRYVVDSGFVKQKVYSPTTGMDALLVVPISQSAATQRAGRCGRTCGGHCFRLYSKESFDRMDEDTVPEIQRSSLIKTALELKCMGVDDILAFDFLDKPNEELVVSSLRSLYLLGALDKNGKLTPLGKTMSSFPTSPFLSRAILASFDEKCTEEMLDLVAMLSDEIWITPNQPEKAIQAENCRRKFRDKSNSSGDHVVLIQVFDEYQRIPKDQRWEWCRKNYIHSRVMKSANDIRMQLREICQKVSSSPMVSCRRGNGLDPTPILRALSGAYFVHLAKRSISAMPVFHAYAPVVMETNRSSGQMGLYLHQLSFVEDNDLDWVIYNDVTFTNRATMRVVSRVSKDWCDEGLVRMKWIKDERHLRRLCGMSSGEGDASDSGREERVADDKVSSELTIRGKRKIDKDGNTMGHQNDESKSGSPDREGLGVSKEERSRLARERFLARKKVKQ